jgi:PEP-CTERM motif-containing protein
LHNSATKLSLSAISKYTLLIGINELQTKPLWHADCCSYAEISSGYLGKLSKIYLGRHMMSLKRVVLIAALVALVMPAAAFADGITFGFIGTLPGSNSTAYTMSAVQGSTGAAIGTTASAAATRLNYTSRFSGNTIPGGGVVPPQIAPTFGSLNNNPPNTFNFGSVSWTTGPAFSANSTSVVYDGAGSSVVISGNGGLPGTGAVLFSGSFTGPTTLTFLPHGSVTNPTCTTCNFWYSLTGPVSGTIDPGLMALLGLGSSNTGNGLFFSFVVGFVGPNDTVGNIENGNISVVVPEPGTLALFGTGLISVAGFIRRRIKG